MTAPAADEPRVGAGKGRPFYCVVCKARNTYFGRLVFENEKLEDATCPNHKTAQLLLPC